MNSIGRRFMTASVVLSPPAFVMMRSAASIYRLILSVKPQIFMRISSPARNCRSFSSWRLLPQMITRLSLASIISPMRMAMLRIGPQPMLPQQSSRTLPSSPSPKARRAAFLSLFWQNSSRTGMPEATILLAGMPWLANSSRSFSCGMKYLSATISETPGLHV